MTALTQVFVFTYYFNTCMTQKFEKIWNCHVVCVCVWQEVYVCIHVHACMCVYVCLCMWQGVYVCVHVCMWLLRTRVFFVFVFLLTQDVLCFLRDWAGQRSSCPHVPEKRHGHSLHCALHPLHVPSHSNPEQYKTRCHDRSAALSCHRPLHQTRKTNTWKSSSTDVSSPVSSEPSTKKVAAVNA